MYSNSLRRIGLCARGASSKPSRLLMVHPVLMRNYATVKTSNFDWRPMKSEKNLNKEDGSSIGHNVTLGLLCLAPVLTFFLGMWQVRRLKWKTKLINEAEDRLTYPPIALPKTLTEEQINTDFVYRKVYLTGKFDYSREIYVGPRLKEGKKGYYLVCPFVQSNGSGEVLVERGWIADQMIVPSHRKMQHLSCPQGEITIEAVIKNPPKRGSMQMEHKKGNKLFEFVDVPAMAEEARTRPVYAQAVEDFRDHPEWIEGSKEQKDLEKQQVAKANAQSGGILNWLSFGWGSTAQDKKNEEVELPPTQEERDGYDDSAEFSPLQFMTAGVPIGRSPRVEYRNNHLQYLITWFSLCIASTILLGMVLKKSQWIDPKTEKLKHARKYMG